MWIGFSRNSAGGTVVPGGPAASAGAERAVASINTGYAGGIDGHPLKPDEGIALKESSMLTYEGKIAVITGGASGIGFAIAARAGAERMTVVIVDIDSAALENARAELESQGVAVHAHTADVSDRAAMFRLAEQVHNEIGETWLLVNNAGVFISAPLLETSPEQADFIIGVNLWGVIHGIQAFLPDMVERDSGYVVNTSSVDGLVTAPNAAIYNATKHAVAALSETLYRELEIAQSAVGISVLCPGAIDTNILESVRHWPARLGAPPAPRARTSPAIAELMAPSEVADITFDAIAESRFWILTHPELYAPAARARTEGVINGANPDDTTVDPNHRPRTKPTRR
jgi:NADP-dependent 3-hydroxy acid dehydrogenase YdfG